MHKLIAALTLGLIASAVSAAPTNWEYQVTIPATGTNCVAPAFAASLPDPSYFCAYTETGEFTDKLDFAVSNPATPITFESIGLSRHFIGLSGRAHPNYTWSTTLTNVVVVDASGNVVVQLVNTPIQVLRPCRTTPPNDTGPCSPHLTDDWKAVANLPVGSYSLVIMGTVTGNRPGNYQYSLTTPVAPVQPPLTPLSLTGSASCDPNAVCTFVPSDVTAIASVAFDFVNNTATVTPAVSSTPLTGPMTLDVSYAPDFSVIYFTGTATVTDGVTTLNVVVTFDYANGTFENWAVTTASPAVSSAVTTTSHKDD